MRTELYEVKEMSSINTRLFVALLAVFIVVASPTAVAQDADKQKIVISLQEDPLSGDPEPACVALQLGTGLLMSENAEVTIFATLGGVGIANKAATKSTRLCEKVSREGKLLEPAELSDVLNAYLKADGEILACPLCWVVRYGDLSGSQGQMIGGGQGAVYSTSPVPLLLQADKVIDY